MILRRVGLIEAGTRGLVLIVQAPDMSQAVTLQRGVDPGREHLRGGSAPGAVRVVLYGDYLCPYCRRLRSVLKRLRQALGERLAYVYRHFPNERAHPGAELLARISEAAGRQGRFWEMHERRATFERPQ